MNTFEPLSAGDSPLPDDASAVLLDLGLACNEASLLVRDAEVIEERTSQGTERMRCLSVLVSARQQARVFEGGYRCALVFREALIGVYARTSAQYAASAAKALAAVISGDSLDICFKEVQPSDVLNKPNVYVPLIVLPCLTDRIEAVNKNAELARTHRQLVEVVDQVKRDHPVDLFDDPAVTSPASLVDLTTSLPVALHEYAASCVSALAIADRRP